MLNLKGVKVFLLVLSILMLAVSYSHAVNVPQMINYSGTLNDINGNPVANGNYSMEFRIYDQASGGATLWTEKWDTTTSQVPVVNGTFNVMLGAIDKVNNPIPASFFADHPTVFLGIKVGNDSEMLPRQMITSVGYALSAWNGVPKGGIIMWSGQIADIPAGWALCDGTNGTPDLRDKFVMGMGGTRPQTGGSATINIAHSHTINDHVHGINATDTSHSHTYYGTTLQATDADLKRRGQSDPQEVTRGVHTHNYSGATDHLNMSHSHSMGGASDRGTDSRLSGAQDILPPYYKLAFIVKL